MLQALGTKRAKRCMKMSRHVCIVMTDAVYNSDFTRIMGTLHGIW